MSEERLRRGTLPGVQRPAGVRWVVYWCGRTLQVVGLMLMVEVLLLFAGTAGMELLLYWSAAAVGVFYTGWACITWAKGKGSR
jgi:hypothetical protein